MSGWWLCVKRRRQPVRWEVSSLHQRSRYSPVPPESAEPAEHHDHQASPALPSVVLPIRRQAALKISHLAVTFSKRNYATSEKIFVIHYLSLLFGYLDRLLSSITCVCDPQGTIFNCFPTNYKLRNDISDSSPASNIEKYQMDQDEKGRDQSRRINCLFFLCLIRRYFLKFCPQSLSARLSQSLISGNNSGQHCSCGRHCFVSKVNINQ